MASRLIFERRRFSHDSLDASSLDAGIGFIWVSLAPKPTVKPKNIETARAKSKPIQGREDFVAGLSLRECQTIADIVAGELIRRGYRRAVMGSRTYCAVEEKVVNDIIAREIDLGEIACQIEEAKMELRCEMSSIEMSSNQTPSRSR